MEVMYQHDTSRISFMNRTLHSNGQLLLSPDASHDVNMGGISAKNSIWGIYFSGHGPITDLRTSELDILHT